MSAAEKALAYLASHHVATLATVGADGPWAAAVFYVNSGYELYFLSSPSTRHAVNLAADARVAATIQEDYDDWPKIKGVQLEGRAEQIAGADEDRARKLYGEKYAIVGKLAQAPAFIVRALAKVRWYRIRPTRLYYIDNSVGFGHRDEVALPR